ncbi:MAG: alkaline phosphatase family protein [Pedosphaera sp.]|nr:alkaline phosphatase family protein [Pedosphaera sp.]
MSDCVAAREISARFALGWRSGVNAALRRLWFVALIAIVPTTTARQNSDTRILLVVLDGFRSDYFTPELMPRCYAAAQQGVIGTTHHSVLPTVTRVNAATLVTGCLPSKHGLVANSLFVPALNPTGSISTGSRPKLLAVQEKWGGRLLATPTLAELLAQRGQKFLACSSGSSGSATLLNPTGDGAGILHPEFCVPAANARHMYDVIGAKPEETVPARAMMRWMTDAYLKLGVPEYDPRVTVMWFTDPDHSAHAKGIGASEPVAGIRFADEQLGRIFDLHRARGLKVNVFIVADHGFATHSGRFNVAATLEATGWMRRANPVVIEGAIYLPKELERDVAAIVRTLQADETMGPIFTAARSRGSWQGIAPGTFSHDLAGGNHPHTAQIVVYPKWNAATNAAGFAGTVEAGGIAGHGATSPWEINAVFAAFGPDIKAGVRSEVPTSNADLAPTILFLAGIPIPRTMDGRVLHEILVGGPAPDKLKVRRQTWTTKSPDGKYSATLQASLVAGRRYVDEVNARHE